MEQGLAHSRPLIKPTLQLFFASSARAYAGDIMLSHIVAALAKMYPTIPICMHQIMVTMRLRMTAIGYGFTSVMMDGSLESDQKTPASYEYNVQITKKVAEIAHGWSICRRRTWSFRKLRDR